jgi:hypothetical protein
VVRNVLNAVLAWLAIWNCRALTPLSWELGTQRQLLLLIGHAYCMGQLLFSFSPTPSLGPLRHTHSHNQGGRRKELARSCRGMLRWGRSDSCPSSPTTRRHPAKPTRSSTGEGACHQMQFFGFAPRFAVCCHSPRESPVPSGGGCSAVARSTRPHLHRQRRLGNPSTGEGAMQYRHGLYGRSCRCVPS